MPYLNPARSLGPSLVLRKLENQWLFCLGPLIGGLIAGVIFKIIFGVRKCEKNRRKDIEVASSVNSSSSSHGFSEFTRKIEKKSKHQQVKNSPRTSDSKNRSPLKIPQVMKQNIILQNLQNRLQKMITDQTLAEHGFSAFSAAQHQSSRQRFQSTQSHDSSYGSLGGTPETTSPVDLPPSIEIHGSEFPPPYMSPPPHATLKKEKGEKKSNVARKIHFI